MFVSLQPTSTLLKSKIDSYVVKILIKAICNQKGNEVVIDYVVWMSNENFILHCLVFYRNKTFLRNA